MSADPDLAYQYDVCLSFAGEQRAFVESVAGRLRARDVRVFYDMYEKANLWGKDLYEHLDQVYGRLARFCVIFVSADYARKVWTTHERRSAQARAFTDSSEYILPARFDDTDLPGIRPTVGHVDLRSTSEDELVDLLVEKLAMADPTVTATPAVRDSALPTSQTPRTRSAQDLLVSRKPPYWEYQLFGSVLLLERERLAPKLRDHTIRYARRHGAPLDDTAAREAIMAAPEGAVEISERIGQVFSKENQEWAFGRVGAPAEVADIIHLGKRFMEVYEDFLDWAANLRGLMVPDRFRAACNLLAQWADQPIRDISTFVDNYVAQVDRIPELLASPHDAPIVVEMELTLTTDEAVMARIADALHLVTGD